jgi:DNA-binding MarR family transcriptional regulator
MNLETLSIRRKRRTTPSRAPSTETASTASVSNDETGSATDFVRAVHEFAHVQNVCAAHWITPLGVSLAQGNILLRLNEITNVTSSELAKSLGLGKASVGRVVRTMISQRVVEAEASPFDKRATSLRLTDLGKSVCARLIQVRSAVNKEVLSGMPEDDLARLVELLHRATARTQKIRPLAIQKLFVEIVE